MTTQSDTLTFLEALFPEIPDGARLLVWTIDRREEEPKKRPKTSHWAADAQEAAQLVQELGADQDGALETYIGCSISPRSYGKNRRCPKTKALGIPGAWADVDWAHGVHKKEANLPPTRGDALDLIRSMPLAPSIIVDSGHGLQPWWLFHEPLIFESNKEREEAAAVVQGWEALLRRKAEERGWTVDSVHDFSRILRVPGGWNRKGPNDTWTQTPKPVKLLEIHPGRRYDLDDLQQYADAIAETGDKPSQEAIEASAATFTVRPGSSPPFQRFQAMLDNVELFKKTWERQRRDLADQSASSYDMSLANQLVRVGWTDQEIVDCLVAFRELHNDKPKLRPDYYARTIAKARAALDREDAMERIDELANSPDAQTLPEDERRRQALDSLSTIFEFRVDRITKTVATRPEYHMWTEYGDYQIGGISKITRMAQFRDVIADATGRWIIVKKDEWPVIVQTILDAVDEIDVGEEATIQGAARSWLRSYLERNPPGTDPEACIGAAQPYVKDAELYLFLEPLRRHVRTHYGDNVSARELGKSIRHLGGEARVVRYKGSTRQAWTIPTAIAEDLVTDETMPKSQEDEHA